MRLSSRFSTKRTKRKPGTAPISAKPSKASPQSRLPGVPRPAATTSGKKLFTRRIGNMRCAAASKAASAVPSFLKGSNFFARPEKGKATEAAWRTDRAILENEHRALVQTIRKILKSPSAKKHLRMLYGVAFHDVYHAGQIRLLRRLQER